MKNKSEHPVNVLPSDKPMRHRFLGWPGTRLGWWAVAMTAIALASFIVFPLITATYRDAYPIVDTWVMPAMMTILFDAAAILSVLSVWRCRERSVLSFLVLVLSVPTALFITMMVIGESIAS